MDIQGVRRSGSDLSGNDSSTAQAPTLPATERASRAAAYERYQALVSNCQQNGSAQLDDTHDAQPRDPSCSAPDLHAVLYSGGNQEVPAISPGDVKQGDIGDCFVMATLCALSASPEGRALIQRAITENKNAQGEIVSYTVTLHRPSEHWFRPTTFTDVQVTVPAAFTGRHAVAICAGNQMEVWPLVLEKAYAAYCGGYGAIRGGGHAVDVMQVLTGREATRTYFEGLFFQRNFDPVALQRDVEAGKMVVLATVGPNQGDIIGCHAYWVTGTTTQDGKLCVTLHNPWNTGQDPPPMPIADVPRYFNAVDVGSVGP